MAVFNGLGLILFFHTTEPNSMLKFQLTRNSGNIKTGKMPVSTSSAATCPNSCPFKSNNSCYAKSGFHLRMHWDKVTSGERGESYANFLESIKQLPEDTLWRHNQAGDLYKPGSIKGRLMLQQLTAANHGKRGYTYTHHKLTANTIESLREANKNGFTVNVSCETESKADRAIKNGLPAALVVKSTETRNNWRTKAGNKVVVCPNQRIDGMTCNKCKLCQKRPSNLIVAFLAHGNKKATIDKYI